MNLYVGCPIWSHKPWVGSFYPARTKPADYLREYARRLTTIEGNTTFYAVPAKNTLQQWIAATPASFRFCPKLPRTISHNGKLTEQIDQAQRFAEIMDQLGERLGPLFLQLPPHYSPAQFKDLQAFLEAWPRSFKLAVEVRHPQWFEPPHHEALNTLLSGRGMARVVIDTRPIRSLGGDPSLAGTVYERTLQARERKPDVPVLPESGSAFVFLRYIGHPQLAVNETYLAEWGSFIEERLRAGTDAYIFCHCPDESLDPWLCREFHRRLAARMTLPPLPWDAADSGLAEQERLF